MDVLPWLLDQAKGGGPLAVAAIAVCVVLWRRLQSEQKTLQSEQKMNRAATEAMARSMTKAMVANAKAIAKLSTKLERRRNGQ